MLEDLPDRGLTAEDVHREIGHAGGHTPGPTVIVVAGIHGNEPAGVRALQRAFRRIESARISLRGELVGLGGNLPALLAGVRYVEDDFNRAWTFDRVARVRPDATEEVSPRRRLGESAEDGQLWELLAIMEHWIGRARGDVAILDLHTTSSRSRPFLVYSDTLRNRDFARAFPIPGILGIEETLAGTMTDYFTARGYASLLVEGGAHEDPASIECHEAAIWAGLVRAGAIAASDVPEFAEHVDRLQAGGRGIATVLEVFFRHSIAPGDEFRMVEGFRNLEEVTRGTQLATDRHGEIRAPFDTRIFLPLYQSQGSDGFFFARPVNRFWLGLSAVLRKSRLSGLAALLPGVRRHPEFSRTLVVDRRVARFLAPQIFHLLGFRVLRPDDDALVVERLREK